MSTVTEEAKHAAEAPRSFATFDCVEKECQFLASACDTNHTHLLLDSVTFFLQINLSSCVTEATMKKFMLTAVLALIVIGTGRPLVTSDSKQTDGSFTTAQRYCPNGRC